MSGSTLPPPSRGSETPFLRMAQRHGWSGMPARQRDTIHWGRSIPFLSLHAAPLAVFLVGWSPIALGVALFMYVIRMFAITAFYHRYFSHRAFKTSRAAQFLFAVLGSASVQKGALWWAAHHRYHHRHADEEADIHSPARHGFWWSHLGWILSDISKPTKWNLVHDFSRYPELRFLDRFYLLVPAVTALSLFGLGSLLEARAPALGTDGWQMLVWGFFVSTFFLFHGTYSINSLAHRFGSRRYRTKDDSRNNRFLAAIALGEGWHNNHHRCPSAARNGFARREIDLTYYGLLFLEKLRIVRDLRPVPPAVLAEGNIP